MKNTGKERAILYREFCEWCNTVPHLDLDPRLHTHSGRIEDGGYISNGVTAKAFAAWQAARRATAAPQPQADALDANRWRKLLNFVRYVDYSMERQEVKVVFDTVRGKKLTTIIDEAIAATKEQPK